MKSIISALVVLMLAQAALAQSNGTGKSPGPDKDCFDEVAIEVRIAPTKLNGDKWDIGVFGFENPDLKMILQPLASKNSGSCAGVAQTELKPIVLPGAETSGLCRKDKHDGDAGIFCRDSLLFSFAGVSMPRLPFHVFMMDVDIGAHDLIFEHKENLFAKKYAILDANTQRSDDESCPYDGSRTDCELKVFKRLAATIRIDPGTPCPQLPDVSQVQREAFAAAGASISAFDLGTQRSLSIFESYRNAFKASLSADVEKAVQACDPVAMTAAGLRYVTPLMSLAYPQDVRDRLSRLFRDLGWSPAKDLTDYFFDLYQRKLRGSFRERLVHEYLTSGQVLVGELKQLEALVGVEITKASNGQLASVLRDARHVPILRFLQGTEAVMSKFEAVQRAQARAEVLKYGLETSMLLLTSTEDYEQASMDFMLDAAIAVGDGAKRMGYRNEGAFQTIITDYYFAAQNVNSKH